MDFSDKIKKFKKDNKLNNREICKIMNGYSETLFSKQIHSKTPPPTLIITMGKYFDLDYNYWLKPDVVINQVAEQSAEYQNPALAVLEEIESNVSALRKILQSN